MLESIDGTTTVTLQLVLSVGVVTLGAILGAATHRALQSERNRRDDEWKKAHDDWRRAVDADREIIRTEREVRLALERDREGRSARLEDGASESTVRGRRHK